MKRSQGGLIKAVQNKFPSPYGVSFILIKVNQFYSNVDCPRFPSPYGVSFILIKINNKYQSTYTRSVFPSPYGVSFILI